MSDFLDGQPADPAPEPAPGGARLRLLQAAFGIALVAALAAVLHLPDRAQDVWGAEFALLPDADLAALADAHWQASRREAALAILDFTVQRERPGALAAAARREQHLAALRADSDPAAQLACLGVGAESDAAPGAFESLAGGTVADGIARIDLARLEAGAGPAAQPLLQRIREARARVDLAPPAEWALTLLSAAACSRALHPALQDQMAGWLASSGAAPGATRPPAALQDALLPVYHLARACRTWPEYACILGQARSPDQLKALAAIAAGAPRAPRALAPILCVAGPGPTPHSDGAVNRILSQGQPALELLARAAGKGPEGLAWVQAHPGATLASIRDIGRSRGLLPGPLVARWLLARARFGVRAMLVKYAAVAVFCALLLIALIPTARGARGGAAPAVRRANYWLAASAVGLTVSLLLLLGALVPGPAAQAPGPAIGPASSEPAPAEPGSGNGMNPVSMTVMVVGILVVQGLCWMLAHRRIKDVETDARADLPTRLKRLENLDIFLDLPLYCGLGGTIFAFILITTFGAGVARFLAYASTLVGIVVCVALRVCYLYPLREQLIRQARPEPRG